MAEVTILSGPIGAGKTAVSKELIALWSAPLAYIEGDQFWPFLVKRAEGDRREDFPVIMRAMTSAAGSFSRTGYDVLLDFSIPPPFVPAAQKTLRDAPLSYIVLRPPREATNNYGAKEPDRHIVNEIKVLQSVALRRRRSAPRPRGRLARRRRPDPKTAFVARVARRRTNQCLPAPIRFSSAS